MVQTITCKVEANDSSKFQAPEELRQACSIPKDSFVPNAEVPKMIIISQVTVLKKRGGTCLSNIKCKFPNYK